MTRREARARTRSGRTAAKAVAPLAPSALFDDAVRHHQAGDLAVAEALYRRLVAAEPGNAAGWSNLGLALVSRGACAEAVVACRHAIALVPGYVEAQLNLVAALEGSGQAEEAIAAYRTVIALQPERVDLRLNLVGLLQRVGRREDAEALCAESLVVAPGSALLRFEHGRVLAALRRSEEACAAYRLCLDIDPEMVAALSHLGTTLVDLGRYAEAAEVARRAQALRPDDADIANNCAVVLQKGGRIAEAADMYRATLAIAPDHAGVWANLGVAYQELFRFDDAMEAFDRAVAIRPGFDGAVVEAIKLRRHICDWSRFEDDRARLLGLIGTPSDAIFMLLLMGFPSTGAEQLACARQHMARLNAVTERVGPHDRTRGAGRLRVGYLSADYRDHPVGRLLPDLLAQHNRAGIDVVGYALGPDDPGRVRRRIARACTAFVDLHGLSNAEAAARIYADRIDVLVDLTGPTTGSRLDLLALRPAPVQVSFLGWPGTTGLDCIDYVLGDAFLTPGPHQELYSEAIVQLPFCYQPSDRYRATSAPMLTRRDFGLPDDGFVFCSFNNTVKLTPDVFDCWLRLLSRVEGSVLWLYAKTPRTQVNLLAWAEARGIAPERIVFAPTGTMDVYLERMRLADLFLDSWPYTAGATCNDALWMGLPVLTCVGDTYVSRMAGSLLRAAGLPELVTESFADYEALALRLATEPDLLAGLRRRLVLRRDTLPLFDMPRFAAGLEAAFAHMRDRWSAGQPAAGFAIGDVAL